MSEADNNEDPEVAPWDLLASALGSLAELEEDEEQLDILQEDVGAGSDDPNDPFQKIPLEKARNLLKVRKTAQDLKEGTITREKYLAILRPYVKPLEGQIDALDTEDMQTQIGELPEEQRPIFDMAYNILVDMLDGLQMMREYQTSGDMKDVDEGLAMVEKAFGQLDRIQDETIELGREMMEEELRGS